MRITPRPTYQPTIRLTPSPTTRLTPEPTSKVTVEPTTASIPSIPSITNPAPEPAPETEGDGGGGGGSSSSSSDEEEEEQSNPEPDPLPSETSTTSSTTEGGLICPIPGDACSNELPRAERCCDGQIGGRNKCKYNAIDNNGFRTGYCCVKRRRDGCIRDADCCNAKDSCINGWCQVPTSISANANANVRANDEDLIDIKSPETETHIVDVYNEKSKDNNNNGHNKSEKLHELLFTTWTAFFIILIIVLPIMYYWYFKVYWLSKLKYVRTRPRSSSIWENDISDYTDRESDWIPSDDSDLP